MHFFKLDYPLSPFISKSMLQRRKMLPFIGAFFFFAVNILFAQSTKIKEDSLYIRTHYTKMERMIPMRDGVKLFTSIYIPKAVSTGAKYPIMLNRTPYS